MVYILNIETATKNCSVSLSKNGQTIVINELAEENFSHAEKLHLFIKDVLAKSKISLSDLNAIAVSKGPGSYTGLRIGVSAAKGLCYALSVPLIAVDTLAILAKQISVDSGIIIPMIDARRMEVFTQTFNAKHEIISLPQNLIVTETSFNDITDDIHLIGDGALKCKEVLTKTNFFYYNTALYPSANEMSSLSYKQFCENRFEDVAYFEPYYLKDFMFTTKK